MTSPMTGRSAGYSYQAGEIQSLIQIDATACKGCDACKAFCPTNAINGASGAAHSIDNDKCLGCGQCMTNCPFNAIKQTSVAIDTVIKKLADKNTTVVGIIAPAVRVAIGEEFGMPAGSLVTGQLYGAMNAANMQIFDCNYAADITIMEEGTEFIQRLRSALQGGGHDDDHGAHGVLPQFTSCCPAWVRYAELKAPKALANLSTTKSPMQIAGAITKTYGTEVYKAKPEQIFTVGVMPCTAKKIEASRPEFNAAYLHNNNLLGHGHGSNHNGEGYPDVDVVLTTAELAQLFKTLNIDLAATANYTPEGNPFAQYSGAGTIFGNTGGVMEAALRTAYEVITGDKMPTLEYTPVRGLAGIKTASIDLYDKTLGKDVTLKVAVVHDMANNIDQILSEVNAGTSPYHFIEVMNCPGGCVNGAGQPQRNDGSSWLGNKA
ncbi:[FeFe] hydrogenase, group A [Ferrimonas senticii]|uniref:[FeFe] hydrogenase, group A n=1 Tax=Ferrimonas senticii TaxID=394566 RepID=UPI0003F9534C|nr:[FeFe] hydrogenase, group A [Ferrimonas senticii]